MRGQGGPASRVRWWAELSELGRWARCTAVVKGSPHWRWIPRAKEAGPLQEPRRRWPFVVGQELRTRESFLWGCDGAPADRLKRAGRGADSLSMRLPDDDANPVLLFTTSRWEFLATAKERGWPLDGVLHEVVLLTPHYDPEHPDLHQWSAWGVPRPSNYQARHQNPGPPTAA